MCYGIFTATAINGFALVTYRWCIKSPTRANELQYCGYAFGIHYPYNYVNGGSLIIHHVVITYAVVQAILATYVYIASSYCAAYLLTVKIDHLNCILSNVLNTKDTSNAFERLKFCIKYHVHIIR